MTGAELYHKKKKEQEAEVQKGIDRALSLGKIEVDCDFVQFVCKAHKEIFLEHKSEIAGVLRKRNVKKNEYILFGKSVGYANAEEISERLETLLKNTPLEMPDTTGVEKIQAAAKFVTELWQIHPFENGNTRLSAVVLVLYLRQIGFDVDNEPFKKNNFLFRDALVRAVYSDERTERNPSYLEKFLRNIFLGEENDISDCSTVPSGVD